LLNEAASLDKDNAIVYNNLGVAYSQKHDYANAERNYLLAKSFGAQNNINLGNTKIRQGDYNAALSYYGTVNACSYNAALAASLAGNYEQALKNLDCAKQNASVYYLRAVIAARTNNLDNLTTNLSRAILEDQSLKAKAVKDLEFKKYAETDAFKVAVR
jgi:Flp pilus assembly protein TadD